MRKMSPSRCSIVAFLAAASSFSICGAFQISPVGTTPCRAQTALCSAENPSACERRDFLSRSVVLSSILLMPRSAKADDDDGDLTSKLYNPDGSIRDDVAKEAKQRTIVTTWDDDSDDRIVSVDGKDSMEGKPISLSYELPEKWGTGDQLYFDKSEGVNKFACKGVTIYQAPGKVDTKRLQKATNIGVGKALDVPEELKSIRSADLIGGRTLQKDGQTYYEYDMAVAPATCGMSSDNLGLGFCPYDTIYLLMATLVNDRLYVIVVESDESQWKYASADLKRVRSSFKVEAALELLPKK